MTNIFKFWSRMKPSDRVHPEDYAVLERMNHGFDLRCLPSPISGRLRTAPVVLLYLSPGWSNLDVLESDTKSAQAYYQQRRNGRAPFRGPEASGYKWITSRTRCFGDWKDISARIAVLNIGAYHSKTFRDKALLAALPSSRVSISWAHAKLFPEAMAGKRVVICLRAHRFWGLEAGRRYGKSLFGAEVGRGGHMKHGEMREQIIQAAKSALGQ